MKGITVQFAAVAAIALSASGALAQTSNPVCQRLEAQLVALDRGNTDPARAEQIRRAEDAVNRAQFEVDQRVAQSRRMGCENSGFFSIFNNPPAQCGGLVRQIDQMRSSLERMQTDLERLNGGTTERMAQRQSLMVSLSNSGCGPQYRTAAVAAQQGGFFDRLFGGIGGQSSSSSLPSGPMGSTYRTLCVRTCDGYFYPISFATTPDRFRDDEQTCLRTCPAAEVSLYTHHNPGEEVGQAVSIGGRPYSELPTAFRYRTSHDPTCSCRRPGETWADALKTIGVDATIAPGDVVVTEQSAKRLSQPRVGADGKPIRPDPRVKPDTTAAATPAAEVTGETDPSKRPVRSVGPTFLPAR